MFRRNAKYYEWLPAYLEDGLDAARQAQMQARLAADPILSAEAERLRRMLAALKASAARESNLANSAVPTDLWPRLQRRLERQAAPKPVRQVGWIAGVGATAALALAAALWLPTEHSGQPKESAKIAKTNPPIHVALTPPNAAVRPVPVVTTPHPVQMAQAAPPKLTLVKPGPFTSPQPSMPVITPHKIQLSQSVVSVTGAVSKRAPVNSAPVPAAKPTLMASRLDGIQNGDRAISTNGLSPAAPPISAVAPASLATDGQTIPASPPMAAFKAVAPEENDTGKITATAPLPPASGLPLETKPGTVAVSPSVPQDAPPVSASTVPRFQNRMRRMGTVKVAVPQANVYALNAAAALPARQSLDTWQVALSAAMLPPLWGEDTGAAQANQTLMAARQAGQLDALRSRLEAWRAQSPQDVTVGRMLAAVYEFGSQADLGLRERRRIAGLVGAGGEDWFALALAEDHAGNAPAARTAYRRAIEAPVPPNSSHAALARQRE